MPWRWSISEASLQNINQAGLDAAVNGAIDFIEACGCCSCGRCTKAHVTSLCPPYCDVLKRTKSLWVVIIIPDLVCVSYLHQVWLKMLTEINRLAVCLLALCLVGHVFAAAAEPQRFVYKARANDNAPRTPPTIAGKPLGGTPLRYDSGQRQYTLDATVGAKAYTLGLSWGTTDIILNPSTKYAGGVNLKKSTPVAFDKTIQLNYYSDTVTVGGVTAHKVPIGSATKSVIIGNTSNHVVGLFGIAPESRDGGYYDQGEH